MEKKHLRGLKIPGIASFGIAGVRMRENVFKKRGTMPGLLEC